MKYFSKSTFYFSTSIIFFFSKRIAQPILIKYPLWSFYSDRWAIIVVPSHMKRSLYKYPPIHIQRFPVHSKYL